MIYTTSVDNDQKRLHLKVQGMIQGVGFRPFVYRLATELELRGWIRNSNSGVEIEVEGVRDHLSIFLERLEHNPPPQSHFSKLEPDWLNPCGYDHFEIHTSEQDDQSKSAWILPDLSICSDCLQEVFDPQNRRYHYPFTNCSHCGPRYSILTALPYDRPNTTLREFRMCPTCQQEYEDPQNRRFHAQPNACSDCGPHLELWDTQGNVIALGSGFELIKQVADLIRQGQIVALKGLGGFHLIVDARNESAVRRLRDRKNRPTKPLAVMYPSLDSLRQDCQVSLTEAGLLTSVAAPIVLLTPKQAPISELAPSIAPHQPTLGVMLPYTPLHHLLLAELGFPVVATSGNRSQEPICIGNQEAIAHLNAIADIFLVHNRPIAHPMDDSVVRVIEHRPMLLRRARGYAPFPIAVGESMPLPCLLSVGGHLKNTMAISLQDHILVSQHLGDLNEVKTFERFHHSIDQLLHLYKSDLVAIACDTHPDYTTTQVAQTLSEELKIPVRSIQHHYAHVLSGMVDNNLEPPVLGIAWDGMGYGLDQTIWGGEFLALSNRNGFVRIAHLRTFPLPGGDLAAAEPRRAALGLLYEAFGDQTFALDLPLLKTFSAQELKTFQKMLKQNINSPRTSSIGRLFDGVAALINLCHFSSFEGEAAMRLENETKDINTSAAYPYRLIDLGTGSLALDWEPMIAEILSDPQDNLGMIAAKFHNTLIDAIVAIARKVGFSQIVLTGGCFQNRYLLEGAIRRLRAEGFLPHWHHQIPPNDGGLAVGQIIGAAWQLDQSTPGGLPCV